MPVKREANSEEDQILTTQKAEQGEVPYPKVLKVDSFKQISFSFYWRYSVTTRKDIIESNKARKWRGK